MKHRINKFNKFFLLGAVIGLPAGAIAQDIPGDNGPPVDIPPVEIPEGPPVEVQEFLAMLEELRTSFLAVVQAEYESGEARAAAIQEWLEVHRPEVEEIESLDVEFDLVADSLELPDEAVVGKRPEATPKMVDLEALLDEKLSAVAADNEALRAALETAEQDREARLAALMEARDARLADMEAARELARQKREEARQNSEDRRADDDPPGGG